MIGFKSPILIPELFTIKEVYIMQFRDLRKQYSVLKQDIDAAMMEVAASSAFIMGRPVKELEAGLAEYVGVKHCIS